MSYRTFLRSARNLDEFFKAEKITVEEGIETYAEARAKCQAYNANRTLDEIEAGTKLEFEEE